jgi:hypothetical protein
LTLKNINIQIFIKFKEMAENNMKTIDENQMINEFDKKSIEKWDEIESLSINNQLLRNKFNFDQQISDSNEKLSKTSIFKLERIDANLRILQNDCNKIINFKDFDQSIHCFRFEI